MNDEEKNPEEGKKKVEVKEILLSEEKEEDKGFQISNFQEEFRKSIVNSYMSRQTQLQELFKEGVSTTPEKILEEEDLPDLPFPQPCDIEVFIRRLF